MKLKIKQNVVDSLTSANIYQHIKLLDVQIHEAFYAGFRACGDNYQEMCSLRESLVAAYNYFSVGEYEWASHNRLNTHGFAYNEVVSFVKECLLMEPCSNDKKEDVTVETT